MVAWLACPFCIHLDASCHYYTGSVSRLTVQCAAWKAVISFSSAAMCGRQYNATKQCV